MKRDDLSNGPAAGVGTVGDEVIIITYTTMEMMVRGSTNPKSSLLIKTTK